ncbi:hypothetical protein QAD02_022106 [Eretmocerus hayati]|uniref:Uncharacterized protein n=1 Tax=Eretmocerus hayati TaxID=131215 RepID=A0ACC2PSC3_9HYME|nr:hypothetical protein QAD02_022106 [Eretmocerus hayati]
MGRQLLLEALLIVGCGLLLRVSGNPIGVEQDKSDSPEGLYGADDLVFVLNATNFKSNVFQSDRAWLVEFYNSWCGYCQRFAPIWKSLAKDVHGWGDIVSIAAIDCADEDNTPLCRDFEIMKYPTLKFFHLHFPAQDSLGLELKKESDEVAIRARLIDQLEKEQQESRGGPSWPNIVHYRGNDLDSLRHGIPDSILYEFLIFEEGKSYLGAEVLLDLHKLDNILVRRVNATDNPLTISSNVSTFPTVVVLSRDNPQESLRIMSGTREGIRDSILAFLKSKKVPVDSRLLDGEMHIQDSELTSKSKSTVEPNLSGDKLYQLDLENALYFSLNSEISLSPIITGEKLDALKLYLKTLVNYFPFYTPKSHTYLQILKEIVEGRSNMTGKNFKDQVKTKERGLDPVYSGPRTWIGCQGSSENSRGYPCGLWTMFHTLTVAAAEDFDSNVDEDQSSVLVAMHAYIKNFFGCADCAEHFQGMAKNMSLFEIQGGDDSILWLWKAHNKVNERLAGDQTEDPKFKKIQYPAASNCPKCKFSDGSWDEVEVLRYLKRKYSKVNIDLQGVDLKLKQHEMNVSAPSSGASYRKPGLSWDFTIFDISLCVLLYVASAAILTLVCLKFAYKKTHKKKISFQNVFVVSPK